MYAGYSSSNKILGDYIVNKSNRNLNKTNTKTDNTAEVGRKHLFKSSIIGGNRGGGPFPGNSGNGNGNGGGREYEDGGEDIFR